MPALSKLNIVNVYRICIASALRLSSSKLHNKIMQFVLITLALTDSASLNQTSLCA